MYESEKVEAKATVGAPEREIEVTPEMIEAGLEGMFRAWDDYPEFPGGLARANILSSIYREMRLKERAA